jgi:DUF1009 family protein
LSIAVSGNSETVLPRETDLAIICGYGSLSLEIARGAEEAGRRPFLVGIEGEAPAEISAWPHEFLAWGQVGRLLKILRQQNIKEVVFAGGIHRRPELLKLKLDLGAILTLPQALVFMLGGDNTVLSGTIKMFEKRGFTVVGAHQIAPGLLAAKGSIAGGKPNARDLANIRLAFATCKALGQFDIGQAVVAEANRVVAVEGVEGTDALLERIVQMRSIGRMPEKGKNGVLVKAMKPGQDRRADLPAIGPRTVEGIVRAGLKGIAVEAGHAIILERSATLSAARAAGIFIHGIDPAEIRADV